MMSGNRTFYPEERNVGRTGHGHLLETPWRPTLRLKEWELEKKGSCSRELQSNVKELVTRGGVVVFPLSEMGTTVGFQWKSNRI